MERCKSTRSVSVSPCAACLCVRVYCGADQMAPIKVFVPYENIEKTAREFPQKFYKSSGFYLFFRVRPEISSKLSGA